MESGTFFCTPVWRILCHVDLSKQLDGRLLKGIFHGRERNLTDYIFTRFKEHVLFSLILFCTCEIKELQTN